MHLKFYMYDNLYDPRRPRDFQTVIRCGTFEISVVSRLRGLSIQSMYSMSDNPKIKHPNQEGKNYSAS
jgi:hypothetical protein